MKNTQVLLVEDDEVMREVLCDSLNLAGVITSGVENAERALEFLKTNSSPLVLSDMQMPGMDGLSLLHKIKLLYPHVPVILITAYGTIEKAVLAMRNGALDFIVKPLDMDSLIHRLKYLLQEKPKSDFIAEDDLSKKLLQLINRVSETDVFVLITGESGVGKEVVAQYIHTHSSRRDKGFVAINCAAIPEQMLEATLFGYEKGAFTGAHQAQAGKFEHANGGTLLLDEISEMDLALQAKLLRVLQEREVERLGGRKIIKLDLRILATSNRDLQLEVDSGRFRQDLFYRLNVFPVHVEPLRKRRKDIVPLTEYFIFEHAKRMAVMPPKLSQQAIDALQGHMWEGNIRELENTVQRALVLHKDNIIDTEDLQLVTKSKQIQSDGLTDDLEKHEQQLILDSLRQCFGNRSCTAKMLGLSPRTLRYKLAKMREKGIEL